MSVLRNLALALSLSAAVLLLSGCGTKRPVLYPNETTTRMGEEQTMRDVDTCIELAKRGGADASRAGEVASQAGIGAGVGAATGALIGVVTGDVGSAAAIGAAGGGGSGLFSGLLSARDPDPVFKNFVEQCLRDKGYQPIGWR